MGGERPAGRGASFRNPERGNVLVLSLLLATLIITLVTAHCFTSQKNLRHSNYVNEKNRMRRIAESGMVQAIHELVYKGRKADGVIGTDNWVVANDLGYDGKSGTGDEGEADGIPSPGEPNIAPARVGPTLEGVRFFTHATDSQWPNVKHVISTAYNGTAVTTLETYVRLTPVTLPGLPAVYIQPGTVLDLNGNSFTITGTDTNPDGTKGTAPEVYGIATEIGSPPGSNTTEFYSQVNTKTMNQVTGLGNDPSIGETTKIDFESLYQAFKAAPKTTYAPATYSSVSWGDWQTDTYRVSYVPGDLHLSGTGSGAGVLVVDGTLTMSGSFTYAGIIIVRGDVKMTGGGAGIHVFGSMLVGQTFTAIDNTTDVKMSGTADIAYSATAIAKAASLVPMNSKVLYWNDLR